MGEQSSFPANLLRVLKNSKVPTQNSVTQAMKDAKDNIAKRISRNDANEKNEKSTRPGVADTTAAGLPQASPKAHAFTKIIFASLTTLLVCVLVAVGIVYVIPTPETAAVKKAPVRSSFVISTKLPKYEEKVNETVAVAPQTVAPAPPPSRTDDDMTPCQPSGWPADSADLLGDLLLVSDRVSPETVQLYVCQEQGGICSGVIYNYCKMDTKIKAYYNFTLTNTILLNARKVSVPYERHTQCLCKEPRLHNNMD